MLKPTLFASLTVLTFLACKNEPKNESTIPITTVPVPVNTGSTSGSSSFAVTEGTVNWSGTYSMGKGGHTGTINVESGELLVSEGKLISGNVTLDINSISVTDIKDPGERRDLESHLKDADFFESDKFPKAEFLFVEVLPGDNAPNFNYVLQGNLTLKGKTAPVNIPVKLSIEGDVLRAESPAFPINRTHWGITFNSGILGTAKDKLIDDTVPLTLKLVAKRKG